MVQIIYDFPLKEQNSVNQNNRGSFSEHPAEGLRYVHQFSTGQDISITNQQNFNSYGEVGWIIPILITIIIGIMGEGVPLGNKCKNIIFADLIYL